MRKAVWITLVVALVLVNLAAEGLAYFSGLYVSLFNRLVLVLGITIGAAVFTGSFLLIERLEQERPLSGRVKDTLGADRATYDDGQDKGGGLSEEHGAYGGAEDNRDRTDR